MKLLGWLHRKIRQNSSQPAFEDFTTGNYYSKPSSGSICGSKLLKQESESFNEQASVVNSELFHGFLAIGTLGRIISEPETPTFSMSAENSTAGEKTEVTEFDLNLINNELEKFIEAEAEAEEERNNESSRRSSYVSVVTLSEKPLEGPNSEDYGKLQACPLQGYLFGSSIELPETAGEEVKKENASLAEIPAKRTHKSVKHLLKKMLRMFHGSASAKKRLNKVRQMFHRRIHPGNTVAEYDVDKDNRSFPLEVLQLSPSSRGNFKEHWIKTDADYLVLEL